MDAELSYAPVYQHICIEDIDKLLESTLDPPIRVKDQILGNGALPGSRQTGRDDGLRCR